MEWSRHRCAHNTLSCPTFTFDNQLPGIALLDFVKKHYDFKMGFIGALVMAGIVFAINVDHGFWRAVPAALKQGTYTLFAGGLLIRLTGRLALEVVNDWLAIISAVMVPSIIAVALTFGVHMLKGTPEPFNSTIPTIILAPLGFLWYTLKERHKAVALKLADKGTD